MKMVLKTLNTLCAISLVGMVHSVSAFYEVGDGELVVRSSPEFVYDTNIFANGTEQSDVIGILPVELVYLRHSGKTRIETSIGIEVARFRDASAYDYENGSARLRFWHDQKGNPLWMRGELGLWSESRANSLIGARTEVDRQLALLDLRYALDTRFRVNGGLRFSKWDYATQGLTDFEEWEVRGGGEFRYSDRLFLGMGYSFRETRLQDSIYTDSLHDHAFFLTATGQILPRVEQSIEIGVRRRFFHSVLLDDATAPYAAMTFEWTKDEFTRVSLRAASDLSISPRGASVEEQRIDLSVRREIDPKISVSAFVYLLRQKIEGFSGASRTDDEGGAGLELDYILTRILTARARVEHHFRSSPLDFADYERSILTVALKIQY